MRLFKLMVCCALISSIGLVGCNKDKNDVDVVPALEMGEYLLTETITECNDESENGIIEPSCSTSDGCFTITLNEDLTAQFRYVESNEVLIEVSGTYSITNSVITLDFIDKTGTTTDWYVEELFIYNIDSNNKFTGIYNDETYGCKTLSEFTK